MKRLIGAIIFFSLMLSCGGINLTLPDILTPPVQKMIDYHQNRVDIKDDIIYSYGGNVGGTPMMIQFQGRTLLGFRTFPGIPVPSGTELQQINPF